MPDEDEVLKHLYLAKGIPRDHYDRLLSELQELTDEFNWATGRNEKPEDIRHYIRTKQKQKKWVTFNGTHRRIRGVMGDVVPAEYMHILIAIYQDMNESPETISNHQALQNELVQRFFEATGRLRRAGDLVAALIEIRKDGLLPHLKPKPPFDFDGLKEDRPTAD